MVAHLRHMASHPIGHLIAACTGAGAALLLCSLGV